MVKDRSEEDKSMKDREKDDRIPFNRMVTCMGARLVFEAISCILVLI